MSKKSKNPIENEEPELKHYLIVILIFILVGFTIFGCFKVYEYYETKDRHDNLEDRYKYPYKIGNVTYNIEFFSPFEKIKELNYPIEVSKLDLLNTIDFRIVHLNYTLEERQKDFGYNVGKASSRIVGFLNQIYFFSFKIEKNLGFYSNQLNCSNSTLKNKVIIFNPKANTNKIKYSLQNGCIEFLSKSPEEMVYLGDAFLYKFIKEE
jgi:hypothetical protein